MSYDNIDDEEDFPLLKVIEYPPTSTFWDDLDEHGLADEPAPNYETDVSMIKGQLANIERTQDILNQRVEGLMMSIDEVKQMLTKVTEQLKYISFDTRTARRHLLPNSGL